MGEQTFQEKLESGGCYARTISVDHLSELKEDVERLRREGLLDEGLYATYLAGLSYEVPAELPEARSIIVVGRPQPAVALSLRWRGRELPMSIPPTYADGPENDAHVLSVLAKAVPGQYRFVKARLPLKTLAARSGLVAYGRNNITYLPKVGSYFRLTAFFTDLQGEDSWGERKMMEGCATCRACVAACPTGAIAEDRTLVRAERCLSYLNEKPASVPFPAWVDPRAHNSLVGCIRCQRVCPYDKGVQGWMDYRGELTEEDTEYLLRGDFTGEEAKAMDEKLRRFGLDLSAFPRNLEALLRTKE